ncbi:MAG: sigma 54-interacting transcriptional regulator [Bacillota bacterium]|nr:sigma 54-interacting transcriptional regulator [Bacillota bacterium]
MARYVSGQHQSLQVEGGLPRQGIPAIFFNIEGKKQDILTRSYPYFVGDTLKFIYSIGDDAAYSDQQIAKILAYRNKYNKKKSKHSNGTNFTLDDFVGRNRQITDILRIAKRVAVKNSPILICGQTGTGKEIIAQGIHNASLNRNGPFLASTAPPYRKICWRA